MYASAARGPERNFLNANHGLDYMVPRTEASGAYAYDANGRRVYRRHAHRR